MTGPDRAARHSRPRSPSAQHDRLPVYVWVSKTLTLRLSGLLLNEWNAGQCGVSVENTLQVHFYCAIEMSRSIRFKLKKGRRGRAGEGADDCLRGAGSGTDRRQAEPTGSAGRLQTASGDCWQAIDLVTLRPMATIFVALCKGAPRMNFEGL